MDNTEKAFDFALSTTKQVVSLSTGILALTITFLNDVASGAGAKTPLILLVSWSLFLISIVSGIFTMMALAGHLDQSSTEDNPSIYAGSIRIFSVFQMITFLLGMLSTVIFGMFAM